LEPDNGGSITPSLSELKIKLPSLTLVNDTGWRTRKTTKYYKTRYDIEIPHETATQIATDSLMTTLTSDDLPAISRELRDKWNDITKKIRFKYEPGPDAGTISEPELPIDVIPVDKPELLLSELAAAAPMFGANPEIQTARVDYNALRPNETFTSWLEKFYPRAYGNFKTFHKSWYIGEKLDYLAGSFPVASSVLHPSLVGVWHKTIATKIPPRLPNPRLRVQQIAHALENHVWLSSLSQKLYHW